MGVTAFALVGLAALRELRYVSALRGARQEELATLGRFAEQLAHDVRNPLAALKGALQFLDTERQAGRSLDAQAHFLGLMLDQVGRMERVVADYQRVAKVEPMLEKQSLNSLIEEAVSLSRFAWPGVKLDVELEPDLPPLDLDRALVTTALENLVRNASEAMPGGGLVTLRTKRMLRRVVLQVADEGRGMDSRELERATDAFFTTKADGSGIGLHFAERVAKAHGGTLELLSTVGQGTVVTLGFTDPRDTE
jgi:signal transduction histidine kinase